MVQENKHSGLKIARKVFIGILNVACAYWLIIVMLSMVVFYSLWFEIPNNVQLVHLIANICLLVPVFVCAVIDLVTMIMLSRNPNCKKAEAVRKKARIVFFYMHYSVHTILYTFTYCYSEI